MADVIVTSWSASGSVSQATYLHYLFVSCTNLDLELDVDYHFVNPGGEELSSGEIPYKKLSLGLLLAWASIAGVILLNLAVVRCLWRSEPLPPLEGLSPLIDPSWLNLSPVRGLHWALLAVPVLSLINNGITRAYFLDASETGHYNNVAGIAGLMAGVMEAAALLTIILLLARGWQITRLSLDRNETRHVFFVVVIFCVGSAAFQLVGGLFFMFLLVLTYVLMLRYVFASVSWKLRLLGAFRLYSRRWFGALPPGDGLADDRAAGANSLLAVEEDDYQGDWLSRGRRGGRADAESGDADRAAIRNNTVYVADGRASPPVVPAGPTAGAANAVAPASQAYTIAVRPPPAVATVGSATTTAAAPPVAGAVQHASGSGRDSDVERGERRSLMTSAEHSDDAAEDGVELAELESIVPPSYAASATHAGSPDGAGTAIAMLATVGTAHAPHPVPPPGAGPRAWFSRARAAIGDPSQVPEGTLTTRQMSTLRYFRLAIVLFLFAEMLVQLWAVLASATAPWIGYLLAETLNAAMLLYLFLLFRARTDPQRSVLYDPLGYNDGQHESLLRRQQQERGPAGQGSVGGYGSSVLGATSVAPGPSAAPPQSPVRPSRLLVVRNPDEGDAPSKYAIAELAETETEISAPSSLPSLATPPLRSPHSQI